jgi:hypothetical protein
MESIDGRLDGGTIVLIKIASVRNSTYKLIRRSLVKCGRQRVAVVAKMLSLTEYRSIGWALFSCYGRI